MALFSRVQIHLPVHRLRERLPLLLEHRLNPELFVPAGALGVLRGGEAEGLAAALTGGGLSCTVHGPFADLNPAADDPRIAERAVQTMRAALRAVRPFAPATVVFHPGEEPPAPGEARTAWLERCVRGWNGLLPLPQGLPATQLLLENIFDAGPEALADLLRILDPTRFGFCFDTGHFQIFSQHRLEVWLSVLGPWLREVHLHDNSGSADDHLPPGAGRFDFPALFRLLEALPHPVIGTLEMHREPDIWQALDYLEAQGVLDP